MFFKTKINRMVFYIKTAMDNVRKHNICTNDCAAYLLSLDENVSYKYIKAKSRGKLLDSKEVMWEMYDFCRLPNIVRVGKSWKLWNDKKCIQNADCEIFGKQLF
jgi:hypothetical protein